jgi:OOP family OmpA-OmpF porin
MMPKSIKIRGAAAALLGLAATSAGAQVAVDDAYLIDQRGVIARSGHGLCWRTAEWTPAKAIAECDPDLVKKAEPAPAPAPAPVVVAPAPTPKPAPLPPPPPPKCDFSDTLAADATFAFGKSELTAGAKKQLDAIAARAGNCAAVSSVRVTGHTDRVGSDAANQKLSEARAAAVKSYLQNKGVNPANFAAVGAGESQPLASVVCADNQAKARLAACLAPNRRVVVEVQGTGK